MSQDRSGMAEERRHRAGQPKGTRREFVYVVISPFLFLIEL